MGAGGAGATMAEPARVRPRPPPPMSDFDPPADRDANARDGSDDGPAGAAPSAVAGPERFAGQGGAAGAYVRQAPIAAAPGEKPPPPRADLARPVRRGRGVSPWLVLLLLVIIAGLCFRLGWVSVVGGVFDPGARPRPVAARGDLADAELTSAAVFEAASPSVVHITGTIPASVAVDGTGRRRGLVGSRQVAGSGFVWNTRGHVVTNAHVVKDASQLRVTLADGSTYGARFVGDLTSRDIAVIKVSAPPSELVPILVGSSADLRVGQQAFAIGSPFGLNLTLTAGIVSGLDRKIDGAAEVVPGVGVVAPRITGAIQTDAAINRGNSGGPLLDSAGRLIGMNTAIFSQSESGGSDGVGFAVPVDDVNRFVPDLIDDGRVGTVGLGVALVDDGQMLRRVRGGVLPTPGAEVGRVLRASAAARAGVEPGDLIVGLDGSRIESGEDLRDLLTRREEGGEARLTVRRGDEEVELRATLQILPEQ